MVEPKQKGIRPGIDKKEFAKSLTPGEIERIKGQREFDEVEPGTITYKIALHLDSLRKQFRQNDNLIAKRLWNIRDIKNSIFRLKQQLLSGEITEKLENGLVMNKNEVETLIQHQEWLKIGEVRSIPESLADMRSVVGHIDYARKEVMTIAEYEEYVEKTKSQLKELGHDIFD